MPNTSSAKKALRGSEKKKVFNLRKKAKITQSRRTLGKLLLAEKPDAGVIGKTIASYASALDKAVKTKFILKNKANRMKARNSARVKKVLGFVESKAKEATEKVKKEVKKVVKKVAEAKEVKAKTTKKVAKKA